MTFARFENLAGRQAFVLDLQARTDQIVIPLPLADLGVGDAVHFVGHRQHCLGEELQLFDMDAQLAGVRDKQIALDADKIAVIEQLTRRPAVFVVERVFPVVFF